MKIWLDDIRNPDDFGRKDMIWITKPEKVIELIGLFDEISFDHDLGSELTGYDVAKAIEKYAWDGQLQQLPKWSIHSANPIGAENIQKAMQSAERGLKIYQMKGNHENTM